MAEEGPLYTQPVTAFRGKTLAEKVQELADREEIRELISRYAHRVAQGLTVADMFTDDGAFIVRIPGRPIQEIRGRVELDERFAKLPARGDRSR